MESYLENITEYVWNNPSKTTLTLLATLIATFTASK